MSVKDFEFSYSHWPFEQGSFHICLSKRNQEDYKILNNRIMNSFYGSHSSSDFICHLVGNGSNLKLIQNYIKSLNNFIDFDKLQNTYSGEHNLTFLNSNILLKYEIYLNEESYFLKYNWDFSNAGVKCLSHAFKLINKINNDLKIIDFGSEAAGYFEFESIDNIELYHSYDWHGEKNWIKININ